MHYASIASRGKKSLGSNQKPLVAHVHAMHGQKIKFIRINNEYMLARRIALYTVIHHSTAGINRTSGCAARAVTTSINHINFGCDGWRRGVVVSGVRR